MATSCHSLSFFEQLRLRQHSKLSRFHLRGVILLLSDYRTIGLSDYRTIGLSDYRELISKRVG